VTPHWSPLVPTGPAQQHQCASEVNQARSDTARCDATPPSSTTCSTLPVGASHALVPRQSPHPRARHVNHPKQNPHTPQWRDILQRQVCGPHAASWCSPITAMRHCPQAPQCQPCPGPRPSSHLSTLRQRVHSHFRQLLHSSLCSKLLPLRAGRHSLLHAQESSTHPHELPCTPHQAQEALV
jgi:hypothetical protein